MVGCCSWVGRRSKILYYFCKKMGKPWLARGGLCSGPPAWFGECWCPETDKNSGLGVSGLGLPSTFRNSLILNQQKKIPC